jgi:hypothetical protein
MLKRNGSRQPQVSKELPIVWVSSETAPVDSSRPIGTPTCGQLPMKPRRLGLPHSMHSVTEPPHSPPTPIPWISRNRTSRVGAQKPRVL